MKKFIRTVVEFFKKFIAAFKAASKVEPQEPVVIDSPVETKPEQKPEQPSPAEPKPEIKPEQEVPIEPVKPDKPEPKTPVQKMEITKFIKNKDGSGGFVNNPNSSRGTMKVVFPSIYTDHIVEVVAWSEDGTYLERFYNKQPGEWGNRERYYGRIKIDKVPKNIIVAARLDSGEVIGVKIPDPQVRID